LPAPDLAITKTHSGPFTTDQGGTFTLSIVNVGTEATTGPITVTDPMPAGLRVVSATGGAGEGWDCLATTQFSVNCTNPGPLAVCLPPPGVCPVLTITVQVSVLAGGPITINNITTVSTEGDPDSFNNTASDEVVTQRPELAPVASPAGLAASVIALIGVAAWGLRRRLRRAP
jgi:uncharacterized repeat protein (TIGR01451 family)